MFDITLTQSRDGYFFRLKCAKAIANVMKKYNDAHVELRIQRDHWNSKVMIKELGERFDIHSYMHLDLCKKEKMRITVLSDIYDEMDLGIEIVNALTTVEWDYL